MGRIRAKKIDAGCLMEQIMKISTGTGRLTAVCCEDRGFLGPVNHEYRDEHDD